MIGWEIYMFQVHAMSHTLSRLYFPRGVFHTYPRSMEKKTETWRRVLPASALGRWTPACLNLTASAFNILPAAPCGWNPEKQGMSLKRQHWMFHSRRLTLEVLSGTLESFAFCPSTDSELGNHITFVSFFQLSVRLLEIKASEDYMSSFGFRVWRKRWINMLKNQKQVSLISKEEFEDNLVSVQFDRSLDLISGYILFSPWALLYFLQSEADGIHDDSFPFKSLIPLYNKGKISII